VGWLRAEIAVKPYNDSWYIEFESQRYAYVFQKVDYRRLKLFFVSLLWRASTSAESFYERIRLGSFEDSAKQTILENDPGETERFAVILARFEDPLGRTMLGRIVPNSLISTTVAFTLLATSLT
jgi:hypothetical protein